MTEETTADPAAGAAGAGAGAIETPAAITGAGTPPLPASDPAALAQTPAATGTETAADIDATWPDDWRNRLAGKDEKMLARLNRFQSVDNVFKSYLDLERKVSSGALKATLPEGAADPEVAAYRKAWGIPDTPEGYGIAPPQGLDLSEPDQADLNGFLSDMHAANAPAPVVQKAVERFFVMQQRAEQQLYDAAQEQTINSRAEIKAEYGRDYDRNVRLAKTDLASVLPAEKAEELVSLTLSDGTKLGDHPGFIRYAVGSALSKADDTALVTADPINASGQTLDEQWRGSLDLMNSDPKKFHTPEHQQRHTMLAKAVTAQRNKRTT